MATLTAGIYGLDEIAPRQKIGTASPKRATDIGNEAGP